MSVDRRDHQLRPACEGRLDLAIVKPSMPFLRHSNYQARLSAGGALSISADRCGSPYSDLHVADGLDVIITLL